MCKLGPSGRAQHCEAETPKAGTLTASKARALGQLGGRASRLRRPGVCPARSRAAFACFGQCHWGFLQIRVSLQVPIRPTGFLNILASPCEKRFDRQAFCPVVKIMRNTQAAPIDLDLRPSAYIGCPNTPLQVA